MFKRMVTLMRTQDLAAPPSIHSRNLHNSSGHLEIHNHMWLDGLRSMLNSVFAKILGRAIVGPARFIAPKRRLRNVGRAVARPGCICNAITLRIDIGRHPGVVAGTFANRST